MTDTRWESRRRSFESTAEAYDSYRPRYPDQLIEELRAFARLGPGDPILEIGSGPGIATVPVAAWGNPMVALEPAAAMAEITRRKLGSFPNADVRTTRFEDAALEDETYGLVFCAQAFHFLDRDTRFERAHRLLRTDGTFALLYNSQVIPTEMESFWERLDAVYTQRAPELALNGAFRKGPGRDLTEEILRTGRFVDVQLRELPWEWTLDTATYIGLLGTHSPHAILDPDVRAGLFEDLAEVIDSEFGGRVTEHYIAELYLARKP